VEVFRAGNHIASDGRRVSFSRSDLDELVSNVTSAAPPPHVITHRELYSPFRYGDVTEAKREGDSLFVRSANIEPQFQSLVESGRLRDRSVRIAKGPSGYRLAHVAWLGAEPPAVEGMPPVQFAATSEHVFDFGDWEDIQSASLFARTLRRLREFLIDQHSVDIADRVIPEWDVQTAADLEVAARTCPEPDATTESELSAVPAVSSSYQAPGAAGDINVPTDIEQKLAASEAENARLQAALDASARLQRVAEFSALAKTAVDEGRLTPALAEGLAEFAAHLSYADEAAFDFASGGQKLRKSPAAWFADFVGKLPKVVQLGEHRGAAQSVDSAVTDFSAPTGYGVDGERMALHRRALDYQAAHPGTDYTAAVRAVENS
jgi:hypothetical protein